VPELPEVETIAQFLKKALVNHRITAVTTSNLALRKPLPPHFTQKLQGKTITAVRRRAKYVLIDLSDNLTWLVHLGMSGRFRLLTTQEPQMPHDHIHITTDPSALLCYHDPRRFGFMDLFPTSDEASYPAFKALGPEPLSPDFTPKVLQACLSKTARPLKTALLDQHIVAGIGNIYACESLWLAQLSPFLPAKRLSLTQAQALHQALQQVLNAAIAAGGSTLRDHRQPDGQNGYFQHQFQVYGRADEPCPRKPCHATIQRVVQGGRSTFYCPHCQQET
jgi:formamidopyrimidine-DNA glycosylase